MHYSTGSKVELHAVPEMSIFYCTVYGITGIYQDQLTLQAPSVCSYSASLHVMVVASLKYCSEL